MVLQYTFIVPYKSLHAIFLIESHQELNDQIWAKAQVALIPLVAASTKRAMSVVWLRLRLQSLPLMHCSLQLVLVGSPSFALSVDLTPILIYEASTSIQTFITLF